MLPRQVETLVEFLMRRPDVDMVFSNVEIIDEAGAPALNTYYRQRQIRALPDQTGSPFLMRLILWGQLKTILSMPVFYIDPPLERRSENMIPVSWGRKIMIIG